VAKYRVFGAVELTIGIEVEANSKYEAIDKAYDKWPGLSTYVGGMVGPSRKTGNAFIEAEGEEVWEEAEEVNDP
jgi:hypothetical protein